MVILGLWVAIIGYGVAYTGVQGLGGHPCSFAMAFQGRCGAAVAAPASGASSAKGGPGLTLAQRGRQMHDRQWAWLAQQPIARGAGIP